MLKLRRQLPVYSPIRFRSLLAGLAGALGLGRPLERLHEKLTERYGTGDLLLTDSGTSALRLAIEGALAVGAESGQGAAGSSGTGVVALPGYCCYDVATAAVGAGARVRLYDLDPGTLGPDWRSLEETLEAGADAVVIVHLYGMPVDLEQVSLLTARHDVLLIEDAAQAFGGSAGGRPLGSGGSLSVLSFGRGKGITGGGGGALLANDDLGRRALAVVEDHMTTGRAGWGELLRLAAQWMFGRPSIYGIPASVSWLGLGETRYREPWSPRGIAHGAAASVLANWEASLAEAEIRRRNAIQLAVNVASPVFTDGTSLAWGAVPLRLPILKGSSAFSVKGRTRGAGQDAAARSLVPGYPDTLQAISAVQERLDGNSALPGAVCLARGLHTAPLHGLVDIARIERALALEIGTRP